MKDDPLGLMRTHNSLNDQTFNDWELIIIVAQKSDSTMDIAKELQTQDSRIQSIGQSSRGIYPAMNEGIIHASGDLIWFMNTGDRFANEGVLNHAVETFSKFRCGVLIGGYKILNVDSSQTHSYPEGNVTSISFAFNRRGGCHQAMMFSSGVIKEIGGFDTRYSLASDFDLVLRIIQETGAHRVPKVYAEIEPGGAADQNIYLVHMEKHQIRRALFGGPVVVVASLIWTVLARARIKARKLRNRLFKSR